MKIRSLISSSLLVTCLGLGISAPAQADHNRVTVWLYDWGDHYPGYYSRDWYYDGHRHHGFLKPFRNRHYRYGYRDDDDGWRHRDGDRHHRGRDQRRHDDRDRHHRR